MGTQEMEAVFPLLLGTGYSEESPVNDVYNCIAFSFGDMQNWWWPKRGYGIYWPPGFPLADDVSVLVRIYEIHGYSICLDGLHELGFEKVAIYEIQGKFKHAARQLATGRWASKLGEEQDIEHELPEHLNSTPYGVATIFMRRDRPDWR